MQEEQKASSTELSLEMELPVFAHAVIWQQAAPAPAPTLAPPGSVGLAPSERGGPALTLVPDPEVSKCVQPNEIVEPIYRQNTLQGLPEPAAGLQIGRHKKQHVSRP